MVVGIENIVAQFKASKETYWRCYFIVNEKNMTVIQTSHGNTNEENAKELAEMLSRLAPNTYYLAVATTVRGDGQVTWNNCPGFYIEIPKDGSTGKGIGATSQQMGVPQGYIPQGAISLELHNTILQMQLANAERMSKLEQKLLESKYNNSAEFDWNKAIQNLPLMINAIKGGGTPTQVRTIGAPQPQQPTKETQEQANNTGQFTEQQIKEWQQRNGNIINRLVKVCDNNTDKYFDVMEMICDLAESDSTLIDMVATMHQAKFPQQ